jgi:undecaprenyl-diphosphatase
VLPIARVVALLAVTPLLLGASTDDEFARELDPWRAAVLGVVEGVTEYLPVSSTGHLLVTQDLLGVGTTDETSDAADTFAITIQAGAILAVVALYHRRLRSMVAGVAGRDPAGRRVLGTLLLAFVPGALVAFVFEGTIKDRLFGPEPVIGAWIAGGIAILAADRVLRARAPGSIPLEAMGWRVALGIGLAQVLALWPGTSRSLTTILAALFLGCTMQAALEFSFLLGLVTLGAATSYEALANGGELVSTFGIAAPLIGVAVAFVSALVAVRWMVEYLGRHGLALFGWYRIGIGLVALGLVTTGVL